MHNDANNYLAKSRKSLEAAKKLIDSQLYNSVPHCAYYSIVQLMKYITIVILNDQVEWKNKGYHEKQIDLIKKEFPKNNYKDSNEFYKEVHKLKKLRVQGDYKKTLLDHNQADKAIQLSEQLKALLKKNFLI